MNIREPLTTSDVSTANATTANVSTVDVIGLGYGLGQGSPTHGPRAKCGTFQKNDGPF